MTSLKGVPKGIQTDAGELLNPNAIIKDTLQDSQHVWVLMKGMNCNKCG